jgi:uncharacterized protein (DUF1697 family)
MVSSGNSLKMAPERKKTDAQYFLAKLQTVLSTFFAFLRAVNVGGNNMVLLLLTFLYLDLIVLKCFFQLPMAKLRDHLSSVSFHNVQTLLQTGNILFDYQADKGDKDIKETLAKKIQSEIESEFGVRTVVMVRTAEDLRDALKNCPWETEEGDGEAKGTRSE